MNWQLIISLLLAIVEGIPKVALLIPELGAAIERIIVIAKRDGELTDEQEAAVRARHEAAFTTAPHWQPKPEEDL